MDIFLQCQLWWLHSFPFYLGDLERFLIIGKALSFFLSFWRSFEVNMDVCEYLYFLVKKKNLRLGITGSKPCSFLRLWNIAPNYLLWWGRKKGYHLVQSLIPGSMLSTCLVPGISCELGIWRWLRWSWSQVQRQVTRKVADSRHEGTVQRRKEAGLQLREEGSHSQKFSRDGPCSSPHHTLVFYLNHVQCLPGPKEQPRLCWRWVT